MVQKAADGQTIEVKFDEAALQSGLADLARQIDRKGENARFVFNDETRQLEVIKPGKIGRTLDVTATLTRMNEALARGDQKVALVVNEQRPDFYDDANAASLGITELVSTGQSQYAGSSAERMKNIGAATSSQHGVIVKPGETFSFDSNLGDVSLDSGYAEALIIYNGRTIKGVGGGVCQVSTTAFRAAFNGGYPIIERWPHAYRVGWYERGAGPGLDASVFSPVVDFKFKNDTPYHILIEAYANDAAGRLTFKFYSTSDGRQVTISESDCGECHSASRRQDRRRSHAGGGCSSTSGLCRRWRGCDREAHRHARWAGGLGRSHLHALSTLAGDLQSGHGRSYSGNTDAVDNFGFRIRTRLRSLRL